MNYSDDGNCVYLFSFLFLGLISAQLNTEEMMLYLEKYLSEFTRKHNSNCRFPGDYVGSSILQIASDQSNLYQTNVVFGFTTFFDALALKGNMGYCEEPSMQHLKNSQYSATCNSFYISKWVGFDYILSNLLSQRWPRFVSI